jgi:indolepyruvate ferredoxin oxidoreductase, alpha subunit
MERSFAKEVEALRLGAGESFRGEGILAVTKALLQSGVSYVGGYQGAPVSHLLDVMVEAKDLLADLGVHVETCTNEAAAAAMLGASINYPLRGAVTWKSIVGTNVAADALSNLASPGVIGGTLIVLGEDYGEGASVIQERSYAYAMKSSIWLLDPRPDLPTIVHMVEKGFELSEASHAPVMLDLRVRACHLTGEFIAKDNKPGLYNAQHRLAGPVRFEYGRLAHPPATFVQERLKIEQRLPEAQKFIGEQKLNELIAGDIGEIGIIVLGGLTNGLLRALARLDLADLYGASRIPISVLNVAYPLVPEEVQEFCAGKRAVLVVEEGSPNYVEQQINVILRGAGADTRVYGKGCLPASGDYTSEVMLRSIAAFIAAAQPAGVDAQAMSRRVEEIVAHRTSALAAHGDIPARPPNFCTGCPERPVFAAIKLAQREFGPVHISADIGCHSFATFAPFSLGNSILGYGMSLASAAAIAPNMAKRPIAVMGDGGFWHNGLITGVASNVFNKGDGVLVIMQNGYASATGQQYLPSSSAHRAGAPAGISIEKTLRSLGVPWLRTVRSYSVGKMAATLKEAMGSAERGLKVIIADGECMLARQRRIRVEQVEKLKRGERVVKTRYGVDDELCTGDHSCIRLSGCPSLTVKPNPDPLRRDPVAAVVESCVGCGLCGEVAHAAVLCPSFYRADIVTNPNWWDRTLAAVRERIIGWLSGSASSPRLSGRSAAEGGREGGLKASELQTTPLSNPAPRLTAYQDRDYARLYLDRLKLVREADDESMVGGRLLAATARQLALRMSYEDVIRVAEAKIDPARLARIMSELAVKPGQTVAVTEFLKPGIDELCSILPPWLATRILKLADHYPVLSRAHIAMAINSRSISGYLRFATLAKLRALRRKTFRFQKEQEAIEAWLRLIVQAAARSAELAIEIAECAGLIKGYGGTHRRGSGNYDQIVRHVAMPAVADAMPLRQAIDGIASARTAALLDPEGEALAKCLVGLASPATQAVAAE